MSAPMKMETGEKSSKKCSFFLKRKNRTCKCHAFKDSEYCAEHLGFCQDTDTSSVRIRIPCPRDPKHSVFKDNLKKHLKKCNVVKREQKLERTEGFAKNINSPDPYKDEEVTSSQVTMRTAPQEEVLSLIEKVQSLYKEHQVDIGEEVLCHDALKDEMNTPGFGQGALKHLKQLASLLGQMKNNEMLCGNTCFVEFGAGKGQLSHWVQRAIPDEAGVEFLLVDRGSNRYKLDGQQREDGGCKNSQRMRIDIEHLDLGQVPCIKNQEKHIVGMSKHLCGAATDLCLRCVVNTLNLPSQETSTASKETAEGKEAKIPRLQSDTVKRSRLKGLIIALCCHHQGSWHHYCGKEFFRQCGLSARDYHIIQSLGGWAVCGLRKEKKTGDEGEAAEVVGDTEEKQPRFDQFSHDEKEEVGRQCKRLIDIGRMKYLEASGYRAVLKKYVSKELTLENVAMIVVPQGDS